MEESSIKKEGSININDLASINTELLSDELFEGQEAACFGRWASFFYGPGGSGRHSRFVQVFIPKAISDGVVRRGDDRIG